jgi:hypothetical protein
LFRDEAKVARPTAGIVHNDRLATIRSKLVVVVLLLLLVMIDDRN